MPKPNLERYDCHHLKTALFLLELINFVYQHTLLNRPLLADDENTALNLLSGLPKFHPLHITWKLNVNVNKSGIIDNLTELP